MTRKEDLISQLNFSPCKTPYQGCDPQIFYHFGDCGPSGPRRKIKAPKIKINIADCSTPSLDTAHIEEICK